MYYVYVYVYYGGGKAILCSASWSDMDTNGVDIKHVVYRMRRAVRNTLLFSFKPRQ